MGIEIAGGVEGGNGARETIVSAGPASYIPTMPSYLYPLLVFGALFLLMTVMRAAVSAARPFSTS